MTWGRAAQVLGLKPGGKSGYVCDRMPVTSAIRTASPRHRPTGPRPVRRGLSLAIIGMMAILGGCHTFPQFAWQPQVHNPFPQLSKVAVVEFFNGTPDDTLIDGLQFAIAYSSELQQIPGFEVVPPDIVRRQIRDLGMTPGDVADPLKRRIVAEALGVDAIVTGVVTEFSPYRPPRLGMHVQWYATNPCLHPIPPGYGLPWGTPYQEEIPDAIVFEAEMALAREQMKTQTPRPLATPLQPVPIVPPDPPPHAVPAGMEVEVSSADQAATGQPRPHPHRHAHAHAHSLLGENAGEHPAEKGNPDGHCVTCAAVAPVGSMASVVTLPPDWPDAKGFIPSGPKPYRPPCIESHEPVMAHTRMYTGNDSSFTAALRNYYFFREEDRFGGWQTYLQRSDDFIRFCCHLHISEMLTARGGAGKRQLVCRWPDGR